MKRAYSAWVAVAILLVVRPMIPAMAAETGSVSPALTEQQVEDPELLLKDIQEVAIRVQRLLGLARIASAEGTFDPGAVRRRAELLVDEVAELERRAARLADPGRFELDAKLAAVQLRATDLQNVMRGAGVIRSADSAGSDGPLVVDRELSSGASTRAVLNDDCASAFVIGTGSFAGNTSEASNDGEATCGSSLDSPDVWFRFVATESGWLVADTIGSAYDTVLSIHSDCPGSIDNEITCNDDSSGLQSAAKFNAYAGRDYLIRVSGVNGATGAYQLRVVKAGEMRGNVRSAADQQPIISMRVTAYDEQGLSVGYDYTDSSGDWVIGELVAGTYYARTTSTSSTYLNELWDDIPCASGCNAADGNPITVTTGATSDGIDFELDQAGRVSGIVRDGVSLERISGATVKLWRADGTYVRNGTTGSTGFYTISGISAGTYYLSVASSLYQDELYDNQSCPGGPPEGCDVTSGTPVTVLTNATTAGVDFSLLPKGRITGTVRDSSNGNPLSSCKVKLWTESGSYLKYVYTASDGSFFVGGLDGGNYFAAAYKSNYQDQLFDTVNCPSSGCVVTSGTPIVVPSNGLAEGVDFDLDPLGRIQGTVTDSQTDDPIVSVQVRIYSEAGSVVDYAYSDASGLFQSDGLPAGSYFAVAQDSDFFSQLFDGIGCGTECAPTSGTPIPVVNSQVTAGVDFAMVPLGRISGTVTRALNGEPVSAVYVRVFNSGGSGLGYAYSQASGTYTIGRLTAGSYYVAALDSKIMAEVFDDLECPGGLSAGCDVTAGTAVEVTPPAAVGGIDFALRMRGTIEGEVVADDQHSLSGRVYAVDASGDVVQSVSVYASVSSPTPYLLRLLPGDYRVVVDCSSNHRDEVYADYMCPGEFPELCDALNGTPVTVAPDDAVQGIDFVVDPLGTISGRLTAEDSGLPLYSRTVTALRPNGTSSSYDRTDSDGRYEIRGLYPGNFYVEARDDYYASVGYVDEIYHDVWCPGGPGEGCDLSSGTPLSVAVSTAFEDIDFTLERTRSISGRVTRQEDGAPVSSRTVEVWDAEGNRVGYDSTDSLGVYFVSRLSPGVYYVSTDAGTSYIDELFDDIPCYRGAPFGCDPTKGTPITLDVGSDQRFVDFAIRSRSTGMSGLIVQAGSGIPIAGVAVDAWSESGLRVDWTVTTSEGAFYLQLDPGTYFVSTENSHGYGDQVFDRLSCLGGSAAIGLCDPTAGTPVTINEDEITSGVDFELFEILFDDGFESGNLGSWSDFGP